MEVMNSFKYMNSYFLDLLKHDKIEILSDSEHQMRIKVADNQVILKSGDGKILYMCDCQHYVRNCNSPTLCKHRDAARLFLFFNPIWRKSKEMIMVAETQDKIQQKYDFKDRYTRARVITLRKLGKSNKEIDEILKSDEEKIIKESIKEFADLEKRKMNHTFYVDLIKDIFRQ